jgi:AcrR family transcriptional regulator
MDEKNSVEEKIINAAIECIEQYGLEGTTNRRIAAIAGVNSAAINYYFRSKDALVSRVMQLTLKNAFDWEDIARLPGDSARERCAAVFNELMAGGVNFPGITRAHFHDVLTEGNLNIPAVERLNEFMTNLAADLKERGASLEGAELNLAAAQITAASLMMILVPGLFQKSFGIDLHDEATRQVFIDRLVEKLLG